MHKLELGFACCSLELASLGETEAQNGGGGGKAAYQMGSISISLPVLPPVSFSLPHSLTLALTRSLSVSMETVSL